MEELSLLFACIYMHLVASTTLSIKLTCIERTVRQNGGAYIKTLGMALVISIKWNQQVVTEMVSDVPVLIVK